MSHIYYQVIEVTDSGPYVTKLMGHFAWIPVFNDDCRLDYGGMPVTVDGSEVTLMEWLAAMRKE